MDMPLLCLEGDYLLRGAIWQRLPLWYKILMTEMTYTFPFFSVLLFKIMTTESFSAKGHLCQWIEQREIRSPVVIAN